MKTKETTIRFTAKTGKEVIVTVHRKYGAYVEHHHDMEDGIDYDTNEFANDSYITVEVPGVVKFETKYLPDMRHPKIKMFYLSNGRFCIGVPDDVAEQIRKAEEEHLTEEISPRIAAAIEEAKEAIVNGWVLPAAELNKKRTQYNDAFNEGGEGYNPFDNYLTDEYVASLKKDYPNQFAVKEHEDEEDEK